MTSKSCFYLDPQALCSDAVKITNIPTLPFKVARYNKSMLQKDTISTHGLYRSVILTDTDDIVCFAPPKSIPPSDFLEKTAVADIVAEEFVEGTMLNLFWDRSEDRWEMATRSIVGAANTFFAKNPVKSFREMFLEAVAETHLMLEELDKTHCYSFVLQHPENRIVTPFQKPHLYLVAVYTIIKGEEHPRIDVEDVRTIAAQPAFAESTVSLPAVYSFETVEELIQRFCSWNTPYTTMGIVLRNQVTGERTKLRNPNYEYVRHLRGNQSKLQYQYLSLRKERKVGNYLTYYPEHSASFLVFRNQVHAFTKALHALYVQCFILKQVLFSEVHQPFKHHLYQLHKLYLNELKGKKQTVTLNGVIHYINQLHPAQLMFLGNPSATLSTTTHPLTCSL
jgi:hypothetical protein